MSERLPPARLGIPYGFPAHGAAVIPDGAGGLIDHGAGVLAAVEGLAVVGRLGTVSV